jgi:hypothetical protein
MASDDRFELPRAPLQALDRGIRLAATLRLDDEFERAEPPLEIGADFL